MGIAKVCVSEICKCKQHELRGFGWINGVWGLGMIVGPAIGGLLSRPAIQYPGSFTHQSIWGKFPYFLPCVVSASIAVFALISIYLFLPETLHEEFSAVPIGDSNQTSKSIWDCLKPSQRYDDLSQTSNHGTLNTLHGTSNHTQPIEDDDIDTDEVAIEMNPFTKPTII